MNKLTRLHIALADAKERKRLYKLYSTMKKVGRNVHLCPKYNVLSIGDNVWIESRVIVLPGVTINEGAVVGPELL